MWRILSQSGMVVVANPKEVTISGGPDKFRIIAWEDGGSTVLGTYHTEKRAKSVLFKMLYQDNFIMPEE